MQRPWLTLYPEGIPAEVDYTAYSSLKDILATSCSRFADLPAYSNMGVAITYRELDTLSRDFAAYLQKVAGMKKGDRLAFMLPNLIQYPIALFGAQRAGIVVVNTNPLYTPRELEHQLKDSGATAIVVLENFAHTLEEVIARTQVRTVITTQIGDMFPAFLQYTGGTTGVAKGAMLTQANMVANVQQVGAWIARDLLDGKEVAIIPLPLYHVYALTTNLVFMKIGARIELITNPRDIPAFVATLKKVPFTAMIGVNTLYNALLNAPGFSELNLHRLKVTSAGGMAVQRAVAERWKQATGVPIIEGYGLTETAPVVISNPLNIKDWTGNIGVPIPSTEAAILDESDAPLPVGEVGEIVIRGPQVMKGYWQRPDEAVKAFTRDGWFRTGDMGFMDEQGRFKITDRKKDMIIVSGFKVFPNEIEDVVMLHPGVMEVAAIGEPDERSGEAVKIVVVKKDPALTENELLEHCKKNLTAYKVPKLVEFRTEPLPKTNIGKILRRELRRAVPAKGTVAA